jgi:diadenylate cyclase
VRGDEVVLLGHTRSAHGLALLTLDVGLVALLRRALAELGKGSRWLGLLGRDPQAVRRGAVDAVVRGALELSRKRVGALVVLERSADLSEVIESGLRVDGAVTPELLLSIFIPGGPLHDGAVVVQGARLAAAGCLLPLSAAAQPHELGTRHRAALGLAEEVDAAVVVVSEERGEISVAVDGALIRHLDEPGLRALLHGALGTARAGVSPGAGSGAGPFRGTSSDRPADAPAAAAALPATAPARGGPLNATTPTHRFDR